MREKRSGAKENWGKATRGEQDSVVHVSRSLVLCECFVDQCLPFCTFYFGNCVFWSSSINRFWLPLWYLQSLLMTCIKFYHVSYLNHNIFLPVPRHHQDFQRHVLWSVFMFLMIWGEIGLFILIILLGLLTITVSTFFQYVLH